MKPILCYLKHSLVFYNDLIDGLGLSGRYCNRCGEDNEDVHVIRHYRV